jgi:hypothetical protein
MFKNKMKHMYSTSIMQSFSTNTSIQIAEGAHD